MSDAPLQNPFEIMGMMNMLKPNPYIQPQWQNSPLPMPGMNSGDAGNLPPTDAQGRPIQSFVDANNAAQSGYQQQLAAYNAQAAAQKQSAPGTTLNSTPNSTPPGVIPFQHATMSDGMPYGQTSLGRGVTGTSWQGPGGGTMPQGPQGATGGSSLGPPPTPPDMRQAYMNALANPGKVTTPGATVAPSNPLGQPNVVDAFLSNHPTGGQGAGNYNNSGFFNTLNKLQAQGA